MTDDNGCYLCQPDNPDADDEGCRACDREFWQNYAIPLAIVLGCEDQGQ